MIVLDGSPGINVLVPSPSPVSFSFGSFGFSTGIGSGGTLASILVKATRLQAIAGTDHHCAALLEEAPTISPPVVLTDGVVVIFVLQLTDIPFTGLVDPLADAVLELELPTVTTSSSPCVSIIILNLSSGNSLISLSPSFWFLNHFCTLSTLLCDNFLLYPTFAGADAEPLNVNTTVPFLSIIISFNFFKKSVFNLSKLFLITLLKNVCTPSLVNGSDPT